ncbi:unnamed protein product [Protopolystoma xenopodis]|uniref:Receptor expression-enhancing protein n=1 Tax=Protopolystoma xenopodis TaxID=117903 RepID=A0A3S5A305_9PLAT|nr:unnamed protein product [Protopolystoma xenopodis]
MLLALYLVVLFPVSMQQLLDFHHKLQAVLDHKNVVTDLLIKIEEKSKVKKIFIVYAIETKAKDDDTKWLTYWVVYASISLIECLIFLYLMLPIDSNGSVLLYTKFIRPLVLDHQKGIDEAIDKTSQFVSDSAKKGFLL